MATDVASASRAATAKLHRASEPDVLKPLIERARLTPESRGRVMDHALALLAELRAAQNRGWVNQFLQEYRLNSSEGVALLSPRWSANSAPAADQPPPELSPRR